MATKSVIEIDVLDDKFKEFQKAFEAYQKSLKGMPADWQKVNKTIDDLNKKTKEFSKSLKDGGQHLSTVAFQTGTISRNMASAALSAAKWVALAAVGGGFGLGGLASNVSDVRKRAAGYGVSTGGLRAAQSTLGRYFDPESVLGNIANLKSSFQGKAVLGRLGVGLGQDPVQMIPEIMRRSTQLFKQFGQSEEMAKELGLTQVFSIEDLRRMASMSERELTETIQKYKSAQEKLAVSDADSEAWRNFFDQMKVSGQTIETSLAKGFKPLIPVLEDVVKRVAAFSEGLGRILEKVMPFVASGYNATREGARINAITDPAEKQKELNRVGAGVSVDWEHVVPFLKRGEMPDRWLLTGNKASGGNLTIAERNLNFGNLRYAGQEGATLGEGGFAKFGSEKAGFMALQNQLNLYASGGSKAAGYRKLDTLQDIMKLYAPPNENDTESYIRQLEKSVGRSRSEHLNMSDPSVVYPLMAAISKVETGKNLYSAGDIKVIIENNTGGSATGTAVAMNGNRAQ